MEEKSEQIRAIIDTICGGYYIYKDEDVIGKAKKVTGKVREYCSFFLQGNVFGLEAREYDGLCNYVIQVLEDFLEAMKQEDTVLMLDTLDYGLRELVDIYKENDGMAT